MGAALALLFAFGARNYVASLHSCPYAAVRNVVRLDFASEPPGATVIHERDGRTMCVTPCVVGVQGDAGKDNYRFELPGYEDRKVVVDMGGGNVQVVAVMQLAP